MKGSSSFVERAITRQELTAANGTLLHVTTGNVKLAFEDSAIVASDLIRMPIFLFIAITNTVHGSRLQGVERDVLSGLDLFRPALDHWHTAIKNALGSGHARILPRCSA